MKRKLAALKTSLLAAVLAAMLAACSVQSTQAAVPDLGQVRSICSLATLECYYHNVAKSTKTAGGGITGIFERDRTFWIEYDGIATLGIDMSLVEMDLDGQNVHISLPPAQVMHISIDEDTLNEESFVYSQDGWNKNPVTAAEQTAAIQQAQLQMEETVQSNAALLASAQNRAKSLIENYRHRLSGDVGVPGRPARRERRPAARGLFRRLKPKAGCAEKKGGKLLFGRKENFRSVYEGRSFIHAKPWPEFRFFESFGRQLGRHRRCSWRHADDKRP